MKSTMFIIMVLVLSINALSLPNVGILDHLGDEIVCQVEAKNKLVGHNHNEVTYKMRYTANYNSWVAPYTIQAATENSIVFEKQGQRPVWDGENYYWREHSFRYNIHEGARISVQAQIDGYICNAITLDTIYPHFPGNDIPVPMLNVPIIGNNPDLNEPEEGNNNDEEEANADLVGGLWDNDQPGIQNENDNQNVEEEPRWVPNEAVEDREAEDTGKIWELFGAKKQQSDKERVKEKMVNQGEKLTSSISDTIIAGNTFVPTAQQERSLNTNLLIGAIIFVVMVAMLIMVRTLRNTQKVNPS